jgi:hypothetical protein
MAFEHAAEKKMRGRGGGRRRGDTVAGPAQEREK